MSYKQFVSNGIIENGIVRDSAIQTSSIDMNNSVITNHNLPLNSTDVANKQYIDTRIQVFTINISGVSSTPITIPPLNLNINKGSLVLNVVSITSPNGPSATFHINKSTPSQKGSIHRISSSAGENTLERLMIEWNQNTSPIIYKTGNNHNGVYQIFLIKNEFLI